MVRKRNRRRKARVFLVPAPLVGLGVFALTIALIYLWMEQSCMAVGQQIAVLERDHSGLRSELARERNKWTSMTAPERLEMALLKHGMAMDLPSEGQVVRVGGRGNAGRGLEYARRDRFARSE